MKKTLTLDMFDKLGAAIEKYKRALDNHGGYYDLPDDMLVSAKTEVADILRDALAKDLISQDMYEEYRGVIDKIDYYSEADQETLKRLEDIYNKQYEDIKEFDEKSKESLDLDNVEIYNYGKETENSNDALSHIENLMQRYESTYDSLGAMGATNAFYRIGNEIKEALKRNEIDKETAKKLMKPLEDMRDNIFDKNLQYQKTEEFYSAVESSFSKDNSNDKTILEKAVDKLHSGEEKGGKEADEKPKEEESKTKNMFSHLMNGRDKKQEKEVQEPKKEDIEKQAKPEELKPKNDNKQEQKTEGEKKPNEHEQKTKDVKPESQIDENAKEKAEKGKEKSIEEKTKESRTNPESMQKGKNLRESAGQEEITEEKALDDLYDLLDKYTEEYHKYQDILLGGGRPNPEAREAPLKAWENFVKAYHSHSFLSPEMGKDFARAISDAAHRDESISAMRDILQKAIYQSANGKGPVVKSFNMGREQAKTDVQEKDIRNPNAPQVQNNTSGDKEVRFSSKDSGLQQKREDLNPDMNRKINPDINYKINDHNGNDVRQEPVTTQKKPTVKDFNVGTQNAQNLIRQQENTAKLREAQNNVPNNQPIDRDTMNNIAAWRQKVLRQNG